MVYYVFQGPSHLTLYGVLCVSGAISPHPIWCTMCFRGHLTSLYMVYYVFQGPSHLTHYMVYYVFQGPSHLTLYGVLCVSGAISPHPLYGVLCVSGACGSTSCTATCSRWTRSATSWSVCTASSSSRGTYTLSGPLDRIEFRLFDGDVIGVASFITVDEQLQ